MPFPRASGILLHPTSLPGPHGIGDLGPDASRWLSFLAASGQQLWQVLPLSPTGFADSPYQSFSAFAANPNLISPERLLEDGLLTRAELDAAPRFPDERVDFGPVIDWKLQLLDAAHERFRAGVAPALRAEAAAFAARESAWLDDFALFMALKQAHGGASWTTWEPALAHRDPAALGAARCRLAPEVNAQRFRQFMGFRQWARVRDEAHAHGIRIIGDVPIFVAHDSADVWSHPELFQLDRSGAPTVVAGVPPDYFSTTGQRWGNPLYRWEVLEREGYAWWLARLRATLAMVDIVRFDHFRGFEACWEIPAADDTAEHGRWVPGPGARFFDALRANLGELPIIAEDLGEITEAVLTLRDRFGLPGMIVLQFAFGAGTNDRFLPHLHVSNAVVYSGTHDNDTSRGWYANAPERERDFVRRYLGCDGSDIAWDLVRAAFLSVADQALVPLQDVLDLGSDARMNLPGRAGGNWAWRFRWDQLNDGHRDRLKDLSALSARGTTTQPQA